MRLLSRIFLGLGIASLLAGGLYFVKLVTGASSLAYVILFPVVVAYSLFGAVACFALALIFYLLRRKK